MIHKGFHRGLAFTKPGFYAFLLILAIGLLAVATGVNGLYIFLSTGLGGFIISGLLSEYSIKNIHLIKTEKIFVDAKKPFSLQCTHFNTSKIFAIYAIKTLLFSDRPRYNLFSGQLSPIATCPIPEIQKLSSVEGSALAQGLKRGLYSNLYAMHATTFPFGLLEKYKLTKAPVKIFVHPEIDEDLLKNLKIHLKNRFLNHRNDEEFYSHRIYTSFDSLRLLDWKRSAGRPMKEWVIKKFTKQNPLESITIFYPWPDVQSTENEHDYEKALSRIRTACLCAKIYKLDLYLDFGNHLVLRGYENCLEFLTMAPNFQEREQDISTFTKNPKAGNYPKSSVRLEFDARGHRWVA